MALDDIVPKFLLMFEYSFAVRLGTKLY